MEEIQMKDEQKVSKNMVLMKVIFWLSSFIYFGIILSQILFSVGISLNVVDLGNTDTFNGAFFQYLHTIWWIFIFSMPVSILIWIGLGIISFVIFLKLQAAEANIFETIFIWIIPILALIYFFLQSNSL